MARIGYVKLFNDRGLMNEMFNLRLAGWSFGSLAIIFNCDKSSIINQLGRYGIQPQEDTFSIESVLNKVLAIKLNEPKIWKMVDGEKLRVGKLYAEYLAERNIHLVR